MPKCLAITAAALFLALLGAAPNDTGPLYTVQMERLYQDPNFHITVQFKIQRADGSDVLTDAADAHFNYGIALAKVQRYLDAAQQFQETLKLQPNYPSAQAMLSRAQQRISGGPLLP